MQRTNRPFLPSSTPPPACLSQPKPPVEIKSIHNLKEIINDHPSLSFPFLHNSKQQPANFQKNKNPLHLLLLFPLPHFPTPPFKSLHPPSSSHRSQPPNEPPDHVPSTVNEPTTALIQQHAPASLFRILSPSSPSNANRRNNSACSIQKSSFASHIERGETPVRQDPNFLSLSQQTKTKRQRREEKTKNGNRQPYAPK